MADDQPQLVAAASLNLQPPPPLSFDGNIAENWTRWKKRFDRYLKATESDNKDDEIKIAILLHTIGDEGQDRFDTFAVATQATPPTYADVVKAFDDHCVPKKK